jgi:hypothetical protein
VKSGRYKDDQILAVIADETKWAPDADHDSEWSIKLTDAEAAHGGLRRF